MNKWMKKLLWFDGCLAYAWHLLNPTQAKSCWGSTDYIDSTG